MRSAKASLFRTFETISTKPTRNMLFHMALNAVLAERQNGVPLMAIMMYARRVRNLMIFSKHQRQHCTTFMKIFTRGFPFCSPWVCLSRYASRKRMNLRAREYVCVCVWTVAV